MQTVPVRPPAPEAAPPADAPTGSVAAPALRLDLSALEPPRQLDELRLEDVTIDGICGVY
jgi:mycofactocin precursor